MPWAAFESGGTAVLPFGMYCMTGTLHIPALVLHWDVACSVSCPETLSTALPSAMPCSQVDKKILL